MLTTTNGVDRYPVPMSEIPGIGAPGGNPRARFCVSRGIPIGATTAATTNGADSKPTFNSGIPGNGALGGNPRARDWVCRIVALLTVAPPASGQ